MRSGPLQMPLMQSLPWAVTAAAMSARSELRVLVPAVVDAVEVPVLAGGGLADGRGLAAALAFGAQGIWMGTLIATYEARAHENYKKRIVATSTAGTVVTFAHSGKPCRLIRNRFTDSWVGRGTGSKLIPYGRPCTYWVTRLPSAAGWR